MDIDFRTFFFSSYELILSIVFGLLTIFISLKILKITFLKGKNGKPFPSNLAAQVFLSSMIVSILIIVHGSILPSVDTLRTIVLGADKINLFIVLISLAYFLSFYLITLVISVTLIFLTIQIYMIATVDIDELGEVKKNNVGVAILMAAVLIGMAIFIKDPVQRFVSSLVNYDSLPQYIQPENYPNEEVEVPSIKRQVLPEESF